MQRFILPPLRQLIGGEVEPAVVVVVVETISEHGLFSIWISIPLLHPQAWNAPGKYGRSMQIPFKPQLILSQIPKDFQWNH